MRAFSFRLQVRNTLEWDGIGGQGMTSKERLYANVNKALFPNVLCKICVFMSPPLQVMAVAPVCSAPAAGPYPLWAIQGHTRTTVCVSGRSQCRVERGSTFALLCWT